MNADEIAHLLAAIRSQRHDFLNHVQVILSFVKQRKYADLERYLSELIGEIDEVNEMIMVGHPALAALIQAKRKRAGQLQVQFDCEFTGLIGISFSMKSIDMTKIVGNLIDNAFDEVCLQPAASRWVKVNGWIAERNLWITIQNAGIPISKKQEIHIFEPGYSTKDNSTHEGIGLAVVKERVEHYEGSIELISTYEAGTQFKIRLPLCNIAEIEDLKTGPLESDNLIRQ